MLPLALGPMVAMAACGEPLDDETFDVEDRAVAWGLGYSGNGDQRIFEGDNTDSPDCLIWDIDGANAIDVRQPSFGTLVLGDDWISDPAGNVLCTAEVDAGGESYLREGTDGEVLLTLWGRFIFEGEVDVPSPAGGNKDAVNAVLGTRSYEFWKDQVFAGKKWEGEVIATSTAHIHNAVPMRKLVIAALVAGECGSFGLGEMHDYD
jgi:hypothetical protein